MMQGSNILHLAKFDLTVTLEPNNPLRGNNVTLDITFKNKDAVKKSLVVQYIKIDLLPIFNVTRIYSNDKDDKSYQNKIRIPQFFANRNKNVSFKYDIYIPKNTQLDINSLIDHNVFNKTDLFNIITIKKCRLDRKSIHLKDDLFIQNNPPIIETANVYIKANQLAPMNEETLLVAQNLSDPLNIAFNISAMDIEDGRGLKYGYFLSRNTDSGRKNETTMTELSPYGNFSQELSIQPGEIYSPWVEIRDSNNITLKKPVVINYRGDTYNSILVPGVTLLNYSALILTLFVTIIITIIIFLRIGSCRQRLLTPTKILISFIIIWSIYYILTWEISITRISILNSYIFFNTIQPFELAVYISEFIIITYFIEACFFLEDLIDFHEKALLINYVSTLLILLLFMFIIPDFAGTLSLSDYYVTMSTLMGTIFALVVTLSTQFPKNIFTSPIVKCIKAGVAINPVNDSTDDEEIFSYPKKLRYFVKLYGAALVVSLLGLVIGTNIEFGTKILNASQLDLYNLLSVAIFETTFLLIPPTVISLYHLMEVISFRGKITIKSDPSGATVFLNKSRTKRSSYVFCWEEIPGNDDVRLRDFLVKEYYLDWVKNAKIKKIDNDKTIEVSANGRYLLLILNDEKTEVVLKIDDNSDVKFTVNIENYKLKIYRNSEKNSSKYSAVKAILYHFIPIDQAEACVIEQPHCLDLCTPCTLMLIKGKYNLKLQKDSIAVGPIQILIRDAVESELEIKLTKN
jgi:hypothetical protein